LLEVLENPDGGSAFGANSGGGRGSPKANGIQLTETSPGVYYHDGCIAMIGYGITK
jgi:hypothetical protein